MSVDEFANWWAEQNELLEKCVVSECVRQIRDVARLAWTAGKFSKAAEIKRLRAVVLWTYSLNPDFDDTDLIGHCIEPMPDEIRRIVIEECQAAEA